MFPEWHNAVPESAYFKVPETLKTFRMYSISRFVYVLHWLATRLYREEVELKRVGLEKMFSGDESSRWRSAMREKPFTGEGVSSHLKDLITTVEKPFTGEGVSSHLKDLITTVVERLFDALREEQIISVISVSVTSL